MNILNKLTIKHLKLNKKRTIISIVGIILSTALMVGIGLLCSTIRQVMIEETVYHSGDYHTTIKELSYNKISYIDENKSVKKYEYDSLIGEFILDMQMYEEYEETSSLYKGNSDYLKKIPLSKGRYPENNTEVIAQSFVHQVGDKIVLDQEINNKKLQNTQYTVVGVSASSIYHDGYNSFYTKDEITDSDIVNVYITYKDPMKTLKNTENLEKMLGEITYCHNYDLLMYYGISEYDNMESFLVGFLIIFLAIISIACIIVIYNSFAISVMERKKQFGLLSSIGTTRSQIRKTVLFEALIVGVIGMILGVMSAYLGIGIVVSIINNLLKEAFTFPLKLVTYPIFLIIPLIFIAIVILISIMRPARSASKISPIEVIRQNDDIKINKKKIKTLKLVKNIFGIEATIALKNIKRNKKKYRITIISLFISIVSFMTFFTYVEVGKQSVGEFIGEYNFDGIISTYGDILPKDKDIIDSIIKSSDIENYIETNDTYAFYKNIDEKYYTKEYLKYEQESLSKKESEYSVVSIMLLSDSEYQKYKKDISLNEDKIIVYNKKMQTIYDTNNTRKVVEYNMFSNQKDMQLNLHLYNNETKWETESFYTLKDFVYTTKLPTMLENVIPAFNIAVVIVNQNIYNEIINKNKSIDNDSKNSYTIYFNSHNQNNINALAKELSDSVNYNDIATGMKMQRNVIVVISILLYGFISLITLIGVTSVFNTINASINLRRREFAVLRSIGLSLQGFKKMMRFESIIFGVKSLVYAIPVGIIMSYLVQSNFTELVDKGYIFPIKSVLISIVGVVIIITITMKYSTNKIKKENILETIRNENI